MSLAQKKELIFSLEESYVRERLVVACMPNGKLAYYFQFRPSYMGEFEESFFHILSSYCVEDAKIRRQFYKAIDDSIAVLKTYVKFKRVCNEIPAADELSREFYSKLGFLTYVELIGNTSQGLLNLNNIDLKSKIKISKIKKSEVKILVKLDQEAHIRDKSSRMNKIFSKPSARKHMVQFYNGVMKRGLCLVARDGKKPVGDIGLFFDKNNNLGLIAAIFVAHNYKNRGISKLLYKMALLEFKKRKLKHYLGATTTIGVMNVAQKIGRVPSKYAYIFKA